MIHTVISHLVLYTYYYTVVTDIQIWIVSIIFFHIDLLQFGLVYLKGVIDKLARKYELHTSWYMVVVYAFCYDLNSPNFTTSLVIRLLVVVFPFDSGTIYATCFIIFISSFHTLLKDFCSDKRVCCC